MLIKYKNPYWIKYSWDMDTNHENQYATEFNKIENKEFCDLFHKSKFLLTIDFKISEDYKNDEVSALFGKAGMNLCLSYCYNRSAIAFEFWTEKEGEYLFYYLPVNNLSKEEIINGVSLTICRNENEFILYKNFTYNNKIVFEGNLINDYKKTGIFLGCANPGSDTVEHRYYSEFDINYLSIIIDEINIDLAESIFYIKNVTDIIKDETYDKIICLYDFKNINNLGIIYDESKYNNFLEIIPEEFLKK